MLTTEKMNIKKIELRGYAKYYITLDLNKLIKMEEIQEIYSRLYEFVYSNKIKVVYEKVFGKLLYKDTFLKKRAEILKKFYNINTPLSYIEGKPINDSALSSILLYGITINSSDIHFGYYPEYGSDNKLGTLLDINKVRYFYLNGVISSKNDNMDNEFFDLYQVVKKDLEYNQFSASDIVRTWIYLKDINKNYEQFNFARNKFYLDNGINFTADSGMLPASTCIGGAASSEFSANIDILCVDKGKRNIQIKRIYNKYQNEADGNTYKFSPSFSRGMSIEDSEHIEIQISGTASINNIGESVYPMDPYNQIMKTIINIGGILEQFGADFRNMYQSTCFFKNQEYYEMYQKVLNDLNIEEFSQTFVVADICRNELLFEIDGVALIKKG